MSSTQIPSINTDYLIVGGGLTGTVIAARLSKYLPSSKITLVEAGSNEHSNPDILSPAKVHSLRESDHVWKVSSTPQRHLNNLRIPAVTGKMLSGSSAMNAGCWTRCSASDYNLWASMVGAGGQRWSYDGQLPYFKKSETWYDISADPSEHGFDGPVKIHPAVENRKYPLRDQVKNAFMNAGLGLEINNDAQAGQPLGLSVWTENWHNGQRQPSGAVYGLEGVEVLTGCLACKILLQKIETNASSGQTQFAARGVELLDGRRIHANKEIIISCGAFRTPQLLMLSGIGPETHLEDNNIQVLVGNVHVGQNLHDQISLSLFYKLKEGTAKGLAVGSPQFNKPEYALGSPVDWMAIKSIDADTIKMGLEQDGEDVKASHPLLFPPRPHTEMVVAYAPVGIGLSGLKPPFDGSIITLAVLNLLPTSRGSIRLTHSSMANPPEINPNYYATATDRTILRAGVRNLLKVVDSFDDGVLDGELIIEPFKCLTPESTDQEIDERVKASASTWYHFGGTAAMGKVVDTELRVHGIKGLRVADASVLPCPLGGHYQAAMFALGEQAADLIANGSN